MAELVDSQNIFRERLTFCRSKDVGQQAFAINLGASLAYLYCSSLYKSRMSSKEAVFTCWKSSKFGFLSILSWFLTLRLDPHLNDGKSLD